MREERRETVREYTYQQEVLTALLLWTVRTVPIAALLSMLGFFADPAWTTLVGSGSLIVLVLVAWWGLNLVRNGQVFRAARIFVISGMSLMALLVFVAAKNGVLLGAMGMGVFIIIATFFEEPPFVLDWGILSSLLYEAGILARSLDPSRDLGLQIDILALYIVPPVILLFISLTGRIINQHLMHALRTSEEAGRDLAHAYAEVEQRVSERTSDLVQERNQLQKTLRALAVTRDQLLQRTRELTRERNRLDAALRELAVARDPIKLAEQRQEINSPYIIGVPLTEHENIFVGRMDVTAQIEQLLLDRRRPPLLLYGQRRMGKTSILNNLGRLMPSTIVPLFIDLQGSAANADGYAGLLYNMARSMVVSAQTTRGLKLPVLSHAAIIDDPFTHFDEWLDAVDRELEPGSALLMLDEFEALAGAIDNGRLDADRVLGMLRHLIQHRPRFKVLLAGSHGIDEFERWSSYLINVQLVQIGYLKEDEARQLIEHPVEDFTLRYESEASQRVLDLTRGHPFLIQLLCAEIVALKNEQDPSERHLACSNDVEAAIPAALQSGSFFFADIQSNQIDHQGGVLLRFLAAQGPNTIISRDSLARQCACEPDTALELLARRDLIETADGGYRFQVELIRRWFAEK